MLSLTAFCLICCLSRSLTQSSTFRESEFRGLRHSQSRHYFYAGLQNKSFGQTIEVPQDPEKTFRYDLWEKHKAAFGGDSNHHHKDGPNDEYFPLKSYETAEPDFAEPEMKIFRTRGKGKVVVEKRGETVHVPNELGAKRALKGTISVRVVDRNENEVRTGRHRSGCRECPSDQTVIAPKGTAFVVLPEPCPLVPRMWNHISGPKAGSKIQEGVHTIRGSIGPKKKYCEYRYEVLVNRCKALKPDEEDTTLECSAENVWGSICLISCGKDKEAVGPTELECREDLTWSNPLPKCKSTGDCPAPKIKSKSKISCQTSNMSLAENDYFPNGSTCKFKQNGRIIAITCKSGRWLKSRMSKQSKQISEKTAGDGDCNPNPCQNGGTCLKPESNKGSPICKCRPQTQGVHCELRECYYNICENDGLCIYQNTERTCYCSPEYGGDRCQNYLNR